MFRSLVGLLLEYLATLGDFARAEANEDMALLKAAIARRAIGAVLLLLGLLWLNIALVIWIIDTPYRQIAPVAIGVVATVVGVLLVMRRVVWQTLPKTRAILREELVDLGVAPPVRTVPAAGPDLAAARVVDASLEAAVDTSDRLREIRIALTREIGGDVPGARGMGPHPDDPTAFHPRSKTMKTLMGMVNSVKATDALGLIGSVISLLGHGHPLVKRLAAAATVLRTLSGNARRR